MNPKPLSILVLSLAFVAMPAAQEEKRIVHGLLLACGQKKLASLEKMYRYGMEFSELSAKAGNANCFVLAWGKRSAIVLDLDAAQLGELKFSRDLMGVFVSKADASGTIRMGDLSPDEMKTMVSFFERTNPHLIQKSQSELQNLRLGLFSNPEVDLVGQSGSRTAHLNLGPSPLKGGRAMGALDSGAFPDPGLLTQKERDESADLGFAASRERRTMIVKAIGVALDNFSEGMKELSGLIESRCRDSQTTTDAVMQKVIDKFGTKLDFSGSELQSAVESSLNGNWESLGFSSRENARDFLKGAQIQNPKLKIGIGWRTAPTERSAAGSIIYSIGSVPIPGKGA